MNKLKIPRKLKKRIKKNVELFYPMEAGRVQIKYYICTCFGYGKNIKRVYKLKNRYKMNLFINFKNKLL